MDGQTLLKELAAGHYDARVKHVIELGRNERDNASALDALETAPTPFARRLALFSCYTSHNGARVLRALRDPSRMVRALALQLVPMCCDEKQAFDALQHAYSMRRDAHLVRMCATQRKRELLPRYIAWLADEVRDPNFCDLLPYAPRATVEHYLERALERPSLAFWTAMRRYSPEVLCALLKKRIEEKPGVPEADTRWLLDFSFDALLQRVPSQCAPIARALLERGILPKPPQLKALARTAPKEFLALCDAFPNIAVFSIGAPERLSPEELESVARKRPTLLGEATQTLERCAPEQRQSICNGWFSGGFEVAPQWGTPLFSRKDALSHPRYNEAFERWSCVRQDSDGCIPLHVLEQLPTALREREARRHLQNVVNLQTRPALRIAYAALLTWDEAMPYLRDYLGHPEGGMRGQTLGILLTIAGTQALHDPSVIDRALQLALQRKNEQDPVRGSMLLALSRWPRSVWKKEHLDRIGQLLRDALDAADLSMGTASYGEALLLRVFGVDPVWGSVWLGTWVKERGQLRSNRLGDQLTEDEVRTAAPQLLSLAQTWSRSERLWFFAQFVESLGTKVLLVEGLSQLVLSAAQTSPWEGDVLQMLSLLSRFDRTLYLRELPTFLATFGDRRMPDLVLGLLQLEKDPPPYLVDAVHSRLVSLPRIELIDRGLRLLRAHSWKAFDRSAEKLLALDASLVVLAQLQAYLHRNRQDLLTPFLGERVIEGRYATGRTRWILPFHNGFYRWNPQQQELHANALVTLLREPDRDTPTLLRCLGILANLDSASAHPLCSFVDDARPAIQERTIRVLGRCDGGQGIPTLLRCLEDTRARIAIYGFRRAVKELPPARAVTLLRGVSLQKVTVAKEVVRLLGEFRGKEAYEFLLTLDQPTLHRDVRIALLRALWDHLDKDSTWEIYDRAATGSDWVLAQRVGDVPANRLTKETDKKLSRVLSKVLDRPEPEARIGVLQRARGLGIADPDRYFLASIRARLLSPYNDEIDAAANAVCWRSTEKDLDAYASFLRAQKSESNLLARLIDRMIEQQPRSHAVLRSLAKTTVELLLEDSRRIELAMRLAAATLTAEESKQYLHRWSAPGALHAAHYPAAIALVDALSATELPVFEAALRNASGELERAAALRALLRCTTHHGWTPEYRSLLEQYQQDVSPLVSGTAQLLFPPAEQPSKETKPSAS